MGDILPGDLFTSGLALMAIGALFAWARVIPRRLASWVDRYAILSVEVLDSDEAYEWAEAWLARLPYASRALKLSASTTRDGGGPPRVLMTPAPGVHACKWRGRWVWLWRYREEVQGPGGKSQLYREKLVVRILSRDRTLPAVLLQDMRIAARPSPTRSLEVHTHNQFGNWDAPRYRSARPARTVVLAGGMMADLLGDARAFFAAEADYAARGLPWRRGYLFEGSPGGGKTSTVLALATELDVPIFAVSLSAQLGGGGLAIMLGQVPARSIVLIEDIDDASASREREGQAALDGRNVVTGAELLNAADGVSSPEGVLFVLTTNHPGVLDAALLRPGRVDRRWTFGPPTDAQLSKLAETLADGAAWADVLETAGSAASMAEASERLMRSRLNGGP